MIDFTKVSEEQLQEVMVIIQRNIERSELEKYYLFSINPLEKAKMFIYCYRFLKTIYNLMLDCEFREAINREIIANEHSYLILFDCINTIDARRFGSLRKKRIMENIIVNDKNIDNLIDSFTVLMEKTTIMSLSKVQGFILEGSSKNEYAKIFNAEVKGVQDSNPDEDFSSEAEESSEGSQSPEKSEDSEQTELDSFVVAPYDESESQENEIPVEIKEE